MHFRILRIFTNINVLKNKINTYLCRFFVQEYRLNNNLCNHCLLLFLHVKRDIYTYLIIVD